jgi:hypothetical protein
MLRTSSPWLLAVVCLLAPAAALAQNVESVGERALGMGGAFVALANDSSATWWNPGGQASGPFLDLSAGWAGTQTAGIVPAGRNRTSWFTAAIPPFGFSYYHFRVASAAAPQPTGQPMGNRQEDGAGAPYGSLSASQVGFTFVQSLFSGVHAGATLKYVRGTLRTAVGDAQSTPSELLDRADDLEGGEAEGHFDVDVGVIAVGGPLRAGVVLRNLAEPEFRAGAGTVAPPVTLERQVRVGAAFDAEARGAMPLVVALDADLRRYAGATGDRRVVAVGAERWFAAHSVAVRGGGRFNTVGRQERAATGGASVLVRSGLLLEAHLVFGGADDERGWGAQARVSF